MNLKDFDIHLDNYLKVIGKELTSKIFHEQYRLCCLSMENYKYFKANSRHTKQPDLTLFKKLEDMGYKVLSGIPNFRGGRNG